MEEMGVKMLRAQPRQPTTGGRFEAFHKTIKCILDSILSEESTLTVEEGLEKACFIYKLVKVLGLFLFYFNYF